MEYLTISRHVNAVPPNSAYFKAKLALSTKIKSQNTGQLRNKINNPEWKSSFDVNPNIQMIKMRSITCTNKSTLLMANANGSLNDSVI